MQYGSHGFGTGQGGPQDDLMEKLKRFLGDTGFQGLEGLLARLFGGVAPTDGGRGRIPPGGSGGSGGGGGGVSFEFPPVNDPSQTGA